MLFVRTSAALALATIVSAAALPATFDPKMVVKRTPAHLVKRDSYADSSHCPGGSIGDADRCTFEATTIYSTTIPRWTQYGSWYDNCASSNTAAIVATVTDSVAVGNSYTETTTLTIEVSTEGFSAGISQSWAESSSTTYTFGESQSITIEPQQNGNINAYKNFFIAVGQLKINYGSPQDGHYVWLTTGLEVFTADPDSNESYSANVGNCGGPISKPNKGDMFFFTADYDNAKAGASTTYTYSLK